VIGLKNLPYEERGQRRLTAAIKLLEKHIERLWRDLETPTERLIICTPDLCVWMYRRFRFQSKRYARSGPLVESASCSWDGYS